MKNNCLIVAGEKSGEEHCLSFIHEIKKNSQNIFFWGVGGDELEREGLELIYHLEDFSSWGFSEVFTKVPFYLMALKKLEREVLKRGTQTAILIDFQTFNLLLAKRLYKRGVKVLYYVAPQAWAWKEWRVKLLEKYVHTLFTIIPFEKKWFQERGVSKIISVPHPLWFHYQGKIGDQSYVRDFGEIAKRPRLLILPGSRNFEVSELLPLYYKVGKKIKKIFRGELGIVISPNVNPHLFTPYLSEFGTIFESHQLVEALKWADLSLACSGTVTLSLSIFSVPSVVGYRSSVFNEFIFDTFVSYTGHISLANIVHGKRLFPEFIQNSCEEYNLTKALNDLLSNKSRFLSIREELMGTMKLISGDQENVGLIMAREIENRPLSPDRSFFD